MKTLKILIVEDEPIVALDIKNTLLQFGHIVTDIVSNDKDTYESIQRDQPDMIFMDIHLENSKSGIEIVKEVKKELNIPIVYLTAFCDDETMQKAIKTNPINYLIKPFKRNELKSSIMLSIYKMDDIFNVTMNIEYTPIGYNYFYDLKNDNLFYKEQPVQIGVKEKMFLKLLISANGEIVPFSRIEEYIWKNCNLSNGTCRTLVYRLRSKLEFKLIETVPSFGYRLNNKNKIYT